MTDTTHDPDAPRGFLGRWSRRKLEGGDEAAPQSDETARPEDQTAEAAPPAKTDADMPPVETIDENSDVSDFFSPEVSETLRRQALRRLFAGPKFNIRDGLEDYDDNYRQFEALGDIMTADRRLTEERRERKRQREEDERLAAEGEGEGAEDQATAQEATGGRESLAARDDDGNTARAEGQAAADDADDNENAPDRA